VFTATKDHLLPTTTTGSWPRPRWYTEQMKGRPLSERMADSIYREQFSDAISAVVSDQERAGIDIICNGDYHLDFDFAGRAWHHYPVERWAGLSPDRDSAADAGVYTGTPGTLLNEIFTGWRYPDVIGKVEARDSLELGKLWRIAQARTELPVKIGIISAQTLAEVLPIKTDVYGDDRRQLILDIADILNAELRELAAAGCKVIQVEEPSIHALAAAHPEDSEKMDFLVEAFNREVAGLEDVEVWVHTCWGNPNMQRVYDKTSYENSVDVFLNRLNIDVWTVEGKAGHMEVLPFLGNYKESMRPKVALGVVSHRTLQVESADEVAADIRRALEHVPLENLVLTSDCGYGRDGANRNIAFYKTVSTALGANIVRRELGLPETEVRAADPGLQVDIPRQGA
jgi:5-methyltetrahydropteroyltriglutamate--homocysteine methyltransferase